MSIKGFKSQQALKNKLRGYTEDQSIDQQRYVTVQEMNGRRHALDVLIHGAYEITTIPLTVEAGSNIRVLKITGHGANKDDIIRLSDGTQCAALSVPDADTIITTVELDTDPTGDTVTIWRHITPSYNADGSLNVTVAQAPISYDRKQAGTTLPTTVLEDLDTPSASKPLPVAIHSIDGAGITVNAGDLSVSTSHVNDSMAIGDGTRLVQATTNNELKTRDNDAITKMGDGTQKTQITDGAGTVTTKQIGTAITASDVGLITNTVIHGLNSGGGGTYVDVKVNPSGALTVDATVTSSALPTGAATSALQNTGNTSLSNIDTNTSTTNGRIGMLTETSPATDTASSGLNGRLQRVAQRLTSLIALFPSSIGQKASTDSLSVVVANDQVVKNQEISSNGTDPFSTKLITYNAQSVSGLADYFSKVVTSIAHGWDSTGQVHREIKVRSDGTQEAYINNTVTVQPAGAAIFQVKSVEGTPVYNQSIAVNGSGVTTITAPTNARGCKVMAGYGNSSDLKFTLDGTTPPSSTVGFELQPGRSEDFTGVANLQVIAKNGAATAQEIYVQWRVF